MNKGIFVLKNRYSQENTIYHPAISVFAVKSIECIMSIMAYLVEL
ncbi:MAG: hypothetical protein PHR50_12540 [Lachnospiraceae bacterium]|nr:hypothetical protein [Lachnospiraceae bacterium]